MPSDERAVCTSNLHVLLYCCTRRCSLMTSHKVHVLYGTIINQSVRCVLELYVNASHTAHLRGFTGGTDQACCMMGDGKNKMPTVSAWRLLLVAHEPFSVCVLLMRCSFEPFLLCFLLFWALLPFFLCLFPPFSGKEASNHTLRPGGPPPIPKSPSKVDAGSRSLSLSDDVQPRSDIQRSLQWTLLNFSPLWILVKTSNASSA